MANGLILVIDQGTTSTRAVLWDQSLTPISQSQKEFPQIYPQPGWVEHDAENIWLDTVDLCKSALKKANVTANQVSCIGITNQRETTIAWNKETGKPLYNAIVWQDRRTSAYCQTLKDQGLEKTIHEKTGLLLDPYFSATKLSWILNEIPEAKELANQGNLAFGTIDCFLLWKLTGGKSFKTDITNASRTLLYNIVDEKWDEDLLKLFNIPSSILPEVCPNHCHFGNSETSIIGASIPITGMAGDQQSATIGQNCFRKGMIKSTYGTGCFVLMNIGDKPLFSKNKLLTTIAYKIDNQKAYALEGSIFMAGAIVQWLRDQMKFFDDAKETEKLINLAKEEEDIYFVPAFTGLGAPYWDPEARGAIYGLSRGTGIPELVKAAIESVCFQTADLLYAMQKDTQVTFDRLKVDGGMAANNWMLQFLSNILNCPIVRSKYLETTALGAATLAGYEAGLFSINKDDEGSTLSDKSFSPNIEETKRDILYSGWKEVVEKTLTA